MFCLFAPVSDEPEVFIPKYSQTAILHAAHFRRVVNLQHKSGVCTVIASALNQMSTRKDTRVESFDKSIKRNSDFDQVVKINRHIFIRIYRLYFIAFLSPMLVTLSKKF